jgi:murein L,D-transpeptidase YcbB/YkuD
MAHELVVALDDASAHGLWPGGYHEEVLEELLARSERPGNGSSLLLADLDLLLTDAFLLYASHLVSGRVDPETLDPEWIAVRREVDLVTLLEEAVRDGRVAAALAELAPDHPGYRRLQDALSLHRRITAAGGWQTIAEGPTIELGREADPVRLAALAARLRATDDVEDGTTPADEGVYAGALETALRRFQERHGIEVDGKVGPKTLTALNVPVAARVEQIEINLERWRWLPQDLGERHVLVNIPDFRVTLVIDGETALEMRAVVGLSYRRTPVFSDLMRYLVVNPSWEVPSNIAVQDKLPLIRQDPAYLARQRMHVYSGWGSEQVEIDPATVDWSALGRGNFPYRLRQDPGPWNALGGVKFMFPNRFNVYLHDTPTRELFGRAERAASSGCIRLEKPLELAERLLADTTGWSRGALERAVRTPPYREQTVALARPVPIHILYWTAWADGDGIVHFRTDLYDRDRRLAEALRRPAPEEPEPPPISVP